MLVISIFLGISSWSCFRLISEETRMLHNFHYLFFNHICCGSCSPYWFLVFCRELNLLNDLSFRLFDAHIFNSRQSVLSSEMHFKSFSNNIHFVLIHVRVLRITSLVDINLLDIFDGRISLIVFVNNELEIIWFFILSIWNLHDVEISRQKAWFKIHWILEFIHRIFFDLFVLESSNEMT